MLQISKTKQAIYLIFGGGLSQLSGFLATIILARKLSSVDYGTYRQLLLVSTLIVPIFSSALPNSLLYFLPRLKSDEERSAFVRRTILILIGLGFLTSIIMVVFSSLISRQFNNPVLYRYLILGSLYPAFSLSSSYLVPFMIAVGQARLSAIYSSVTALINLTLVSCVIFTIGSIDSIVIALVTSSLVSFILAMYLSNRHLKIFTQKGTQVVSIKEQISYAVPLGLASIMAVWGLKLDQAIVSSYFDTSTYAIYSVGAMEFPLVGLISGSIFSVLLPEVSRLMAEGRKDEVLKLWQRTIEKSMLIIMPIFGAAMIMSYPLITIIYTKKYELSVPIFQIYLFLIPIRTINFGLLLRSVGKTKYDFYGSILFIVTNFAFAIFTIKLLGIYGPTISMIVSIYILVGYLLYNIKKEIGFKINETLNVNTVLPLLLVTVLPIILFRFTISSLNLEGITKSSIALIIYSTFIIASYKYLGKLPNLNFRKCITRTSKVNS